MSNLTLDVLLSALNKAISGPPDIRQVVIHPGLPSEMLNKLKSYLGDTTNSSVIFLGSPIYHSVNVPIDECHLIMTDGSIKIIKLRELHV